MSLTGEQLCEIQGLQFAALQQAERNLNMIAGELERRRFLAAQQAQAQAAKETADKAIGAPPIQQPPLPGGLRRATKKKR